MLLTLLATAAFAGGLDDVRPRRLQEDPAAFAEDADGRVVALVDRDDVLWVGAGRLRALGALSFTPDTVLPGDPIVLSRTEHRGLVGTTDWAVLSTSGGLARKGRHAGRLLGVVATDEGAALLFPDALLLIDGRQEEPRVVPLPFARAQGLFLDGDAVVVEGAGDDMLVVGLDDGCPRGLAKTAPEDDLAAVLWRETARLCSAPPRHRQLRQTQPCS